MNPVLRGDREWWGEGVVSGGGPLKTETLAQSGMDASELLKLCPSGTCQEVREGNRRRKRKTATLNLAAL